MLITFLLCFSTGRILKVSIEWKSICFHSSRTASFHFYCQNPAIPHSRGVFSLNYGAIMHTFYKFCTLRKRIVNIFSKLWVLLALVIYIRKFHTLFWSTELRLFISNTVSSQWIPLTPLIALQILRVIESLSMSGAGFLISHFLSPLKMYVMLVEKEPVFPQVYWHSNVGRILCSLL